MICIRAERSAAWHCFNKFSQRETLRLRPIRALHLSTHPNDITSKCLLEKRMNFQDSGKNSVKFLWIKCKSLEKCKQ